MRKLLPSLVLSFAFAGVVLLAIQESENKTFKISEIETVPETDLGSEIKPETKPEITPETTAEIKIAPEEPQPIAPQVELPQNKKLTFPQTLLPNLKDLPRLKGYKNIAKNDPWIGDIPCGIDIFNPPQTLPKLSPRRDGKPITDPTLFKDNKEILNQSTFLYSSKDGITLRLVDPVIKYYEANGRSFREAHKDIFDRQPLKENNKDNQESRRDSQTRKTVTLANLSYPTSLSYVTFGHGETHQLPAKDIVLTSTYIVTLPKWTSYRFASQSDQNKWDDLFCKAAHHELGHLRIHLDLLSETLNGYAHLPKGVSQTKLKEALEAYGQDVSAANEKRQEIYHIYNGGGIRIGMTELPYAELPFPWLKTQSDN